MAGAALEASIAAAVEAGDLAALLALVDATDWRAVDPASADQLLQLVARYGYSGRTRRYEDAIRAMLAGGCRANLASCALLCDNAAARRILDTGPDTIHDIDAHDATALHHAAERGNTELAAELCERGALLDPVDENGQTPLARALHAGPWKAAPALDIVALLRQRGARVDFWTLAALGDADALKTFLRATPECADECDSTGRTALFHAARNNHIAAVTVLLDGGADPNAPCADGQTPLSTACLHMLSQECDVDIVRMLVANGATKTLPAAILVEDLDALRSFVARDPTLLAGQDHESALGYAIHAWRPRALACLLDAGAQPDDANWAHIERIAGRDEALIQDLRRRAGQVHRASQQE